MFSRALPFHPISFEFVCLAISNILGISNNLVRLKKEAVVSYLGPVCHGNGFKYDRDSCSFVSPVQDAIVEYLADLGKLEEE